MRTKFIGMVFPIIIVAPEGTFRFPQTPSVPRYAFEIGPLNKTQYVKISNPQNWILEVLTLYSYRAKHYLQLALLKNTNPVRKSFDL